MPFNMPSNDEFIKTFFNLHQALGKLKIDGESAELLANIRKDIGTLQQLFIQKDQQDKLEAQFAAQTPKENGIEASAPQ